ncbi:MAG: hypothetical protein KatS3mg111_0843 [Pirellulaceae bacterium]|nr:MAG: hypothetical protein KatS3mg111_0843 [Pirellulaceae bacterium]
MNVDEFVQHAEQLATAAEQAFAQAQDADSVEQTRVEFLGARSGKLKELQKQMGGLPKEARKTAGMKFNETKQRVQRAFDQAQQRLASSSAGRRGPAVDITLPGYRPHLGAVHPITQTIEHLKEIMGRLGFTTVEGPEVEDTWHNFIALNIPEDHPARDPPR